MCGIFGISVRQGWEVSPRLVKSTFNELFTLSESRGKEAAGMAILAGDTIKVHKRPVPASTMIRSDEYDDLVDGALGNGGANGHAFTLIGHSRLVTDGAQQVHGNNQPVITPGVVGIHNGIIVNDEDLWRKFPSLERRYEIDTEVLPSKCCKIPKSDMSIADRARTFKKLSQRSLLRNSCAAKKNSTAQAAQFDHWENARKR